MTSATAPAAPSDTSSDTGWYVVPDHGGHAVEREWDGDVWLDRTRPAPDGTELPHHRRDIVAFLRPPGWILATVFVVGSGIAYYLAKVMDGKAGGERTRAEGLQWLAAPLSGIAAAAALLAVLVWLDRRVEFRQVVTDVRPLVLWGVLSGVIGVAIGLAFELGIPRLFDSSFKQEDIWQWIPGPAEELGKLLLPAILWFTGRFRLPRQGFLLVLISGITFGIIEGTEYGFRPEDFQISRPLGELMHPLLAGIAAAVAWRAAWGKQSWFTLPGVLAVLYVMALNSLNDGLIGLSKDTKVLGLVTPLVFTILYFSMKFAARQLVPPDNVAAVSPMWRPVAPKHSTHP